MLKAINKVIARFEANYAWTTEEFIERVDAGELEPNDGLEIWVIAAAIRQLYERTPRI